MVLFLPILSLPVPAGIPRLEIGPWRRHDKRMDKDRVAEILVEIGILLELKGENPFKTRAYANAARTIESLSEPLAEVVAADRLGEIKGIGEALEKKITELVEKGKLAYYDELNPDFPYTLHKLMLLTYNEAA